MKKLIAFFLVLLTSSVLAQDAPWIRFIDPNTGLAGYKDTTGKVILKPKFISHSCPPLFKNIISVYEKVNVNNPNDHILKGYYLLRNGKMAGMDSVYTREFTPPNEADGKILFRDRVTDKVGYFDSAGRIAIPAIYNEASDFRNGLAVAIKDAKRKCYEGKEFSKDNPCEHWYWEGNVILIDTNNRILLENLKNVDLTSLDFYSLQVNKAGLDSMYVNFPAKDGTVYSFINHKRHFISWVKTYFLPNIDTDRLITLFSPMITIPKSKNWKSMQMDNSTYADYAWIKDKTRGFIGAES